jgi:Cdc6-like AAA superfamily ATPase
MVNERTTGIIYTITKEESLRSRRKQHMNIDTEALRPVFDAYTQTSRESVRNTWLDRFVTTYHDLTENIDFTTLSGDDLTAILTPFLGSDQKYGGPAARQLSGLSVPGWQTFCEATFEDSERGAAVLSALFDESRDLDRRLKRFDAYYQDRLKRVGTRLTNGRITFSPAIRLGIPTGLLMVVNPQSNIIYKFSEFRSFFGEYTDYTVSTAGSVNVIDQYMTLIDGCRKVRDVLKAHVDDTNMLDVRNVIWTYERLCESGESSDSSKEGDRWKEEKQTEQADGQNREDIGKPQRATEIAKQLEAVGQIILYGPPGTGKTQTAIRFAEWWTGRVETVTFHPSVAYEDFVEGRTATVDDEGNVGDEYRKGVFIDFVERAREEYKTSPDDEIAPRYVLVIDEINRGQVANIFGELITCLERDHRTDRNDISVRLAHSKTLFSVPPNVYLIGTMNTAERSIGRLDPTLRRRFRFLAFPPNYDLLCERVGIPLERLPAVAHDTDESSLYTLSILALKSINRKLRADIGRGKQIGHTYLLSASGTDELVDVWRYELLPLLEEYYYTNINRLRDVVFDGRGDRLFDWSVGQIQRFDAEDLRVTLDDLIESSSRAGTTATTDFR